MCSPLVFAGGIAIVLLVMFIYIRVGPTPSTKTTYLPTTVGTPMSTVYTLSEPSARLVDTTYKTDDDDTDDEQPSRIVTGSNV